MSHPFDNVVRNIRLLHEGDPDKRFGMSGLRAMAPTTCSRSSALRRVRPRAARETGPVPVDPELVLDACAEAGNELALAIARSERVVLATGHPFGLSRTCTAPSDARCGRAVPAC